MDRRLFFALVPPAEVRRRVLARVRPTLAGEASLPDWLRIVGEDDLHLTLCFLGSFPEGRRSDLERVFGEELRGLSAPELVISGTGVFPATGAPRILWAGVAERSGDPRLGVLAERVRQTAFSNGWRPPPGERTRPFRPHLTLARVRGPHPAPDAFLRATLYERWTAEEALLVESRPDRPERRYVPLASAPLIVRPD